LGCSLNPVGCHAVVDIYRPMNEKIDLLFFLSIFFLLFSFFWLLAFVVFTCRFAPPFSCFSYFSCFLLLICCFLFYFWRVYVKRLSIKRWSVLSVASLHDP
jgi:hypothetical protein